MDEIGTQRPFHNAKRNRDSETDSEATGSSKKKQSLNSPYRALSIERNQDSTMEVHLSMKHALLELKVGSPPLHTEDEYAAMVPDSPRSRDLDFSEPAGPKVEASTYLFKFHSIKARGDLLSGETDSNRGDDIRAVPRTHAGIIMDYPTREPSHNGDFAYSPLPDDQVRLLRLAPGAWKDPVHCALKPMSLRSLERGKIGFQALSYAWGTDAPEETIFLQDVSTKMDDTFTEDVFERVANRTRPRSFLVRKNLYEALKRYRHPKANKWFWIDAICINQANNAEKSRQISYMPAIYSSAYNVAIWLGEAEGDDSSATLAVALVPKILNLRAFHTALSSNKPSDETFRSWIAFSCLLQRGWFRRRWVIQEVACAIRLSIRVGDDILSWGDFADAVELFFSHFDRIKELYDESDLAQYDPDALNGISSSGVIAIIDFSRNTFMKTIESNIHAKLMDLQSLVLAASSFAVSEVRDVIYALLHLANDAAIWRIYADYSRTVLDVYADFVDYCLLKESSLDIICRKWAHWPPELNEKSVPQCPSWVGLVHTSHGTPLGSIVRIDGEPLVCKPSEKVYNASRGNVMQAKIMFHQHEEREPDQDPRRENPRFSGLLIAKGIKLGRLRAVSSRVIEGTIAEDGLKILGWKGRLEHGVPDQLWRTLVANRGPHSKAAPPWYRRACALALTKASAEGDLSTSKLLANKTQPATVIEFLKRVQAVVWSRRFFRCTGETEMVGFGPRTTMEGDIVCILFGCSVPVILRVVREDGHETHQLIGECYVHGYMEGEAFAGQVQETIDQMSIDFQIS